MFFEIFHLNISGLFGFSTFSSLLLHNLLKDKSNCNRTASQNADSFLENSAFGDSGFFFSPLIFNFCPSPNQNRN